MPTQITQQEEVEVGDDLLWNQSGTGPGIFLQHLKAQGSPSCRVVMNNTPASKKASRPGRKPATSSQAPSHALLSPAKSLCPRQAGGHTCLGTLSWETAGNQTKQGLTVWLQLC